MTVSYINMRDFLDSIRDSIPHDCFSDAELLGIIKGTENQRYGLVKRAIANGELLHLRRGLYCLTERYRRKPLNLFEIVQKIYGPSYISFESALSYHAWIPEAVHSVTSACAKRSREFTTPLGVFSFIHVPVSVFLAAVDHVAAGDGAFFMARPWRAIADYVYAYRKSWKGIHPLVHSLRIDEEHFEQVDADELEEIRGIYRSRRVGTFLKGVLKDLNL